MKKRNRLMSLTVILGILVVVLGGYLAYIKLTGMDNIKYDNCILENQDESDVKVSSDIKLLDSEKLEKYKNNDGTYGIQKSFVETNYSMHLSLIGEVEVCYQSDCKMITNLSNVVDMVKWTVAGAGEAQKVLFLLDNGDLYSYGYANYSENIFEAEKVEGISNVVRIVEFSYSALGKGGNWGAIAITENNEYIEVYRESI